MKQFFYTVLLVALMGFNTQKIEAKEAFQGNYITFYASEYQYFTCSSNFFKHTANRENCQYLFQWLFPTLYKFSTYTNLYDTKTRLLNSVNINSCVVKSENQIIRFEDAYIIQPYNYFW